ncbi:MAG: hypothetical protein QOJ26_252 [Thermoplasmata archaeon]|jgi:hypothetical protein|nr:hypothetical protein [Thermoplasmata archaeon]
MAFRPAAALLLAATLLGGCLAGPDPAPAAALSGIDGTQELLALPGERAVAAEVGYHEEVDASTVDLPFAEGDDGWEPRDVLLTYHGVQPSYDEFARPVSAHVFRFPEMVFVADDVSFGPDGPDVDGHYEVHDVEYLFARADDRFMGLVDLKQGFRFFEPPMYMGSLAGLTTIAMSFHAADGDPSRELQLYEFMGEKAYMRWEPFDGFRPMEGECAMLELKARYDPPLEDALIEEPTLPEKEHHTLVCLDEGLFPLWAWSGSQADGSYRLQRTTSGIELAPKSGQRMPVVDYQRQPMAEVSGPLPVVGPLLVPPSSEGGSWAQQVSARAAALYLSPGYLQYRAASQLPYVQLAWVTTPFPYLLEVGGIPIPPTDPLYDSMTLFLLQDGAQNHFHVVYSREGGPERPDLHVAEPNGYTSPDDGAPASEVPSLVPDGALEGQLSPLAPPDPQSLLFALILYDFDDDGTIEDEEKFAAWDVERRCTYQEDGLALWADGVGGYAQLLARLPAETCDPDPFSASSAAFGAFAEARATGALPGLPRIASWAAPGLPGPGQV